MKKYIFIIAALAVITQACRKTTVNTDCGESVNLQLQTDDVFVIGSTGGFGGSGRGTFKIKNGQLFSVGTNPDSLLTNDKFLITNTFTTDFPKSMKDTPNQNWRSQCNDTFTYFVEWTNTSGTKQSWYYDSCPSESAPKYAQCYFKKVIKGLFTP